MNLLAYSYPRFVETLNKFHKQARRERLKAQTPCSTQEFQQRWATDQAIPNGRIRADKAVRENYPHEIWYPMNDITTFNWKRQSSSNTKSVSLKMCEVHILWSVFRFAFWPMKDHDIIQGQRSRCTKDYFYFYPQIFPYLFAIPLCLEMGRWHMKDSVRAPLPAGLTARAVLLLRHIQLLKMLLPHQCLFHMWFVKERFI